VATSGKLETKEAVKKLFSLEVDRNTLTHTHFLCSDICKH
jgi:hypothetical protein